MHGVDEHIEKQNMSVNSIETPTTTASTQIESI